MKREEREQLLKDTLLYFIPKDRYVTDEEGNVYYREDVTLKAMELSEQLLPPAEGAIADINFIKWYSGMEEQKIRSAFERYKREVMPDVNAAKQPTAKGAEEILRRIVGETENGFKRDFAWFSEAIAAMNEFATLHAQKIADKMVEWISVEDKLPEEHEDVLCYNGHRISSHNWCKYTDQDDEWFKKTFTHWCKLPKIPKP